MWVNLLLSIDALNHSCLSWLQGNVVNLKQAEKFAKNIVQRCILYEAFTVLRFRHRSFLFTF